MFSSDEIDVCQLKKSTFLTNLTAEKIISDMKVNTTVVCKLSAESDGSRFPCYVPPQNDRMKTQ